MKSDQRGLFPTRAAASQRAGLYRTASSALLALLPIVWMLRFEGYEFSRPESMILLSGTAVLGGLWGSLANWAGRPLGAVLIGALLTFCLDWLFAASGLPAPYLWIGLTALSWFLWKHLGEIVLAFALVFAVSTLILPAGGAESESAITDPRFADRDDLPPIIHIILDEHVGLEGIPAEIEEGRLLKKDLSDRYTSLGFRLFGNAFSRYFATYNSLPNMVNLSAVEVDGAFTERLEKLRYRLLQNAYFGEMRRRGYRIRVYQSSFLDFCRTSGAEIFTCRSYPANAARSVLATSLGAWSKAEFLLHHHLNRSQLYRGFRRIYREYLTPAFSWTGFELPGWAWDGEQTGPMPALKIIREIERDVREDPRGTLFFAHLIIPHYPYVFDAECRPYPSITQRLGLRRNLDDDPEDGRRRQRLYFKQARCAHNMLERIFEGLREGRAFQDATILVHSDHGSRLTGLDPFIDRSAPIAFRDFQAGFSTFFALKAPGLEPGYDEMWRPLEEIFAAYLNGELEKLLTRTGPSPHPYVLQMKELGFAMQRVWIAGPWRRGEPDG